MHSWNVFWSALVLGGLVLIVGISSGGRQDEPDAILEKADRAFDAKNYQEAVDLYRKLLAATPRHAKAWHAGERVITCELRLRRFDAALEAADVLIKNHAGTGAEARAERLAGNLWLDVPHWGSRSAGTFSRGEWKQGLHVQSHRFDKRHALAHHHRARELYAKFASDPAAKSTLGEAERSGWEIERIEALFDYVAACAAFSGYSNDASYWSFFGAERDDATAESAGEGDFEESQSRWDRERMRPIGLRVDAAGNPIFPTVPANYDAGLPDDEKFLWLLAEIRTLDTTSKKIASARSVQTQATFARIRFGLDQLRAFGWRWHQGEGSADDAIDAHQPWTLADDQALTFAGGKLRVVVLPPQWSMFALLESIPRDFPESGAGADAIYTVGVQHQSRQNYPKALDAYARVRKTWPDADATKSADIQEEKIRRKEVVLGDSGVQPVGTPASLTITHRNVEKAWFTVREIDLVGFLNQIRAEKLDKDKGHPDFWSLGNWQGAFLNDSDRSSASRRAARFIGKEIARLETAVTPEPGLRYGRATIGTPLTKPGVYLVHAYTEAPDRRSASEDGEDARKLGQFRGILVLSDLAFVEKTVTKGTLTFVCDAATGAPIAGARVEALEVWNEWQRDGRKNVYYEARHDAKTDQDGLALLARPDNRQRGQWHALITAADPEGRTRVAWTGMQWFQDVNERGSLSGRRTWLTTDRPVYRPNQPVRYKAWLREQSGSDYRVLDEREVTVIATDPRGNEVFSAKHTPDPFGGIDGSWILPKETPLGPYALQVKIGNDFIGGGSFRVEEYKKPEFEVTVDSGATHAKLGDKLTATIKANYYFGAPVVEATVSYKLFREEFRFRHFEPGPWDWLYGEGYGLSYYEAPWFPWWRGGCMPLPPDWWWGCWAWWSYQEPVRELVREGSGKIGPDGTIKIEIDTASALRDHPDRDHRYVVEAEVRDASRRVVTGEGAVTVTRQAFYASLASERGFARPGETVELTVRTLTPDGKPVKCDGQVTLTEVVSGESANAELRRTEIDRWTLATDEQGFAKLSFRPERSGQFELRFQAPDAWGGTVDGYALVWVAGDDFDGSIHRFNDLEIITDRRSYRPGETARVMINTKAARSHVLFSDDAENGALRSWKVLALRGRSTVVDVPIKSGHRPNFFVEATTVAGYRVFGQTRQICVPPEEGVMTLSVKTDKAEYRPGETCKVTVSATAPDGKPADAQVVLSVFDRSLLAIQSETTASIARFFHGAVRTHSPSGESNLNDRFATQGGLVRPFENLYPFPAGWNGPSDGELYDSDDRKDGGTDRFSGRLRDSLEERAERKAAGGERGLASRMAEGAAAPGAPAPAPAPTGGLLKTEESESVAEDSAGQAGGKGGSGSGPLVGAKTRTRFADTAAWLASLRTGTSGTVEASFEMPENLTGWKFNAWGMTTSTRVGDGSAAATTKKNFLVRLQAPRFFLEKDEVVLSANVHNYLALPKRAKVSLKISEGVLALDAESPASREIDVPANGEVRVDWRVKVLKEGTATVAMEGLTDEESDAMETSFPVLVHGAFRQEATTSTVRPDETEKTLTLEVSVPEERRPELTRLEIRYAPSLVGAMLDAVPYCLDYPYGCTEQTMSRFVPAILARRTLQDLGITLEDVAKVRGRLAEVRRMEKDRRWNAYADSPVFDSVVLDRIIKESLARIGSMQQGDGGWGWWSNDRSSPYLSSYVLQALCLAQECDVAVDAGMIERGMNFLQNDATEELARKEWSVSAHQAFVAYVLSIKGRKAEIEPAKGDDRPGALLERLWKGRDALGLYGKALLSLAYANLDEKGRAKTALENILQFAEENRETQVAWLRTAGSGWWYWWNDEIETNAWVLRAMMRVDPKNPLGPKLVKGLLDNRRNGYYWRSTRDTTLCIAAIADFVRASGESEPDYTLTIDVDGGAATRTVRLTKAELLASDNRFVLEGEALGGGKHTIRITKNGKGALYLNSFLSYFTKEDDIPAAGHALKVERSYRKLVRVPYEVEVNDAQGNKIKEARVRYDRVPLEKGAELKSGDLIQVELELTADNHYTYLALEDMKPAGFEPLEVKSGSSSQEGFWTWHELRDDKTVFFLGELERGKHLIRYRLRAEIPGVFNALPTQFYAMYVPELRANAAEHRMKIVD